MKIISLFVMFVLMGIAANAQDAKVIAELAASKRTVKNSPFSAEAVSESVQTLADGNRIVRRSTSKLYRNSEGRFRREFSGGSGGVLGSAYTLGPGVTIMDPAGGVRYMIDDHLKTTRQVVVTPHPEVKVITSVGESVDAAVIARKVRDEVKAAGGTAVVNDRLKDEIRAAVSSAPAAVARTVTGQVVGEVAGGIATAFSFGNHPKWETRTEELGTQNIEGVDAEGTRTITTIPADAIGNERPIEITYEKWYSRELQLVVMSKHNDPRFGEQTYRVTNIVRAEPDPSLFTPPQGYKMVTEPSGTYRVTTAAAAKLAAEKTAAATKATPVANKP